MSAEETKEILKKAYLRIRELEQELAAKSQAYEPIAIVGGALRFAGAGTPSELFDLLLGSNNMVVEHPVNRWQVSDWKSDAKEEGKAYSFAASYLEDIELFDNLFFNIPPEECLYTDPQQRLLLETTVEALQSAGIKLAHASGSRTAVFIGSVNSGYDELVAPSPTEYSPTGSIVASASGKISYKLNLKAPALTIDTACSSSLAAIHLGCKSIQSGESDIAIAGGVNLIMTPRGHIGFSQLGAMTTSGKAKVFDKDADGFSRGEGCGVVVLKKLKDAERDGDNILGVIRGSAMNHDGQSNGYTAPSQQSQEEVIQEALRLSGLDASNIGYIEAHGTGTSLGDSIELQALHKVFGKNEQDVFLGSIKANLGHTEYAAGIASIFKTLNVLQHRKVPKQIHIKQLNPHFNWAASALKVSNEQTKELGELQYAGVSGFGISGTNVHLVLERRERRVQAVSQPQHHVLYISARSQAALENLLHKHIEIISSLPTEELAVYVRSNNTHRDHFEYRVIVTGNNCEEICANLRHKVNSLNGCTLVPANLNSHKVIFIFPGQGSQWFGMAAGLFKYQSLFRNTIKEVEAAIQKHIDIPLCEWIENGSEIYLKDERTIQPVLFAIQVALTKLWMSYGIKPDVLLGISMGEIAAMHIAGALSMDDAVHIIYKRSQLLVSGVSGYEMCIAEYNRERLNDLLQKHKDIEVSGYYSDTTHLFSGPGAAVDVFIKESETAGIFVKKVKTSVASHCSAVNGILTELEEHLQTIVPAEFNIPVFSTVYNRFADRQDIGSAYWLDNLKLPIRFSDSVTTLEDLGCTTFIEISAHPLTGNYLQQIFNGRGYTYQPTLFRDHDCNDVFYKSLELLYQSGAMPVFTEQVSVHTSVPLYAWDKQLFPIPYNNYGRNVAIAASPADLQLLLPEWKIDNSIQKIQANRSVLYCSFNSVEALTENDGRYTWSNQSGELLAALKEIARPVVAVDVSGVERIEDIAIVIDALKKIESYAKLVQADIILLAYNTIPVTGGETLLNAAGYAWLGLARSLQAEWDDVKIHWIDTDKKLTVQQLLSGIGFDETGTAAVFREGDVYRQYVHMYNHMVKTPGEAKPVLIVGGTSAMGLMMAGWYAENGAGTIVLHGMRQVPGENEWDTILQAGTDKRIADIIAGVRELRSKGNQVILSSGDICNKHVVAGLKKQLNDNNIQLHDIVYAAGTSRSYFFSENDTSEFIEQSGTRITGWQNLTDTEGLDFKHFIFISSASGFFRSIGQSPYLFSNHWIDAAVAAGDNTGRKYTSILFPIWKEIGRTAEEGFLPDTLLEHVTNADLKRYFNAIAYSDDLPPVVIAARPADNILTHLWKQVPFIPGRGLKEWVKKQELRNIQLYKADTEEILTDELSLRLKSIWRELLGRPEIYAHDHFFQAGGNSVLLIKLANRIKSNYPGIDIKVPELIKNLVFEAQYELLKQEISVIGNGTKGRIERAGKMDVYPASEEQKQIWIQSQLDEDASLYNLTGVYSYRGNLNANAFSNAVRHIAAEQEIFRTRYMLEDGNVVQAIDDIDNIPIDFFETTNDNELEQLTNSIFKEESTYRFDLSVEHSFRIKIISGCKGGGVIILNLHHIASDGWALGYYTTRLAEVYAIYCNEQIPATFITNLTYKDYAVFQQQYLTSDHGTADSLYWSAALSGGGAASYLQIDNARPAIFEFHGRKLKLFVDEQTSSGIKSYVEKNGISLYAFLQTGLSAYLSSVSGENRIVTGTPMSSRVDERLENVVGNFVNLLPVGITIDKTESFNETARRVQDTIANILLHQLYPFNRIVQDLKIKRDPSRHPVFDILFVLQNHTEADFQLQGLEIERKIIDPEHSKLDLFIEAREHEKAIEFNFEYNDKLFGQNTIIDFWKGLQGFLSAVLQSPAIQLETLVPVINCEKNVQVNNILISFDQQCQLHPDKTAIQSEYLDLSYKALSQISEKFSDDLRRINNELSGQLKPVAIACGRSVGQVVGMLGIWKASMVYMPVNITQAPTQLLKQVELSGCEILICNKISWADYKQDKKLLSLLKFCVCYIGTHNWEIYKIENGSPQLYNTSQLLKAEVEHNDAAYIVFTSGTTGQPKAIAGRHDSLAHFINWQSGAFAISNSVNSAWLIQPTFDASFRDVLLPLCNGGTLHIPEQETWELMHALVKWVDASKVTVIHIVPSLFRLLLSEIEAGYKGVKLFENLQYIFLSGEALYKNDIERWQHIFGQSVQLVNFYGSSETTLIRTFYKIPAFTALTGNVVPVGQPVADTEVYVVDDKQNVIREEGNILVSTAYPTLGYLTAAGITAPFINNFIQNSRYPQLYESGDIGYWDGNNNLVITGRADDQVKVHGIRMHIGAVEDAILEIFKCSQLAVVYNAEEGILRAYYQSAENPDIPVIRQYISDKLSPLHIPDVWTSLVEFPLTAHGKVNRAMLKTLPTAAAKVKTDIEPLQTEAEKKLSMLWTSVLKCEQAGRNDNFFELGGNSLNGLVLLSRIHKDLKRKITLRVLFANPVLSDMAAAIEASVVDGLRAIPKQPFADWYPVSQAQRRMWILHNMEENSITYNIKRAYELTGYADKELFEKAFNILVEKQDSLRTNFKIVDGVPVQFVRGNADSLFTLAYKDLSNAADAEAAVRVLANEEVQYNFDLESESLLRAQLVKLGDAKWVLLINLHHIISDGWSMELLMRELFDFYEKLLAGITVEQASLPLQYKDYTYWQQERIATNAYSKEREYWLKELEGEVPVLELPADNARSKIKTYEGEPLYFRLNGAIKARVEEMCRKYDVSLFMFLLSTVKVLLHKYTGQRDLIIGSPVAGREHPDLNGLVGFFVNMLALRSEISEATTFEDYLQLIRRKTLEGFENQSYPFDKLVEELPIQRNTSRSPLFDITVQVLNVEFWESGRPGTGLKVKPFIADWQRSQFDLSFFFKEEDNSIFALIEFNNTIYSPKRIERLIAHFNVLLENILSQPSARVDALHYIPKAEEQQLLYNNNDIETLHIPFNTVLDAIKTNSVKNNIAVDGLQRKNTYGALEEVASKLSASLLQCGQRKKPVGVLTDDRSCLVEAMVGIMRSGNIYMPLDAAHPVDRLKYMLKDAGVEVLVVTKDKLPLADKLLWEYVGLKGYICLDSDDIYTSIPNRSELMRQDLWNYVGEQAKDDIEAGGWISSYTGFPFSAEEMEEYAVNALRKIEPYLSRDVKVLEIGCSSGLTLFKVAPLVASYTGIDLSEEILNKTRQKVTSKGLSNVSLHTMYADEIDTLDVSGFDVVIINSVIQSFGSYNYFRKVIRKVIDKVVDKAILFLGDVQDAGRKEDLIKSLKDFSIANPGKNYRTKITWDDELFYHQDFIKDLAFEFPCFVSTHFSDKYGDIKNELSLFRFDAIIQIDKHRTQPPANKKIKWQMGRKEMLEAENTVFPIVEPASPAYIIYTSGTTGKPKGVLINHDALLNQVFAISRSFEDRFSVDDNVLMVCRSTFDVSVLEMFIGLCHGACLVEIDMSKPLGAAYLTTILTAKNITWAYLPPALLNDIAEEVANRKLQVSLKKLLVGVEPIQAGVLKRLTDVFPGIFIVNGYGPTETTIVATSYKYTVSDDYTVVPIGRPLPGYKVYILSDNCQVTGIGIPGEIIISGKGVANGYINNEKLTAEKFRILDNGERAYWTGDIGVWDAKGNIHFVGRKDNQVKFNGYRIELSEIEAQLAGYPGVTGAIVLVNKLDEGMKQLVAFVKTAEDIAEIDLKQFAASCLPEFMLPQRIIPVKDFPLTAHGKTDFQKLLHHILAPGRQNVLEQPVGKIETNLLELYRSLLGQQEIGVTDNFFDLGGHSLVATRLVSRAANEYGLSIPLVNVFIHPTVRELAIGLGLEAVAENITPVLQNEEGLYALSYAQNRLWIIDHLNPDDDEVRAAYNMVGVFEVKGQFDIAEFNKALQLVIDSHEILRTNFISIDGIPYQKIHTHVDFLLEKNSIPDDIKDEAGYVIAQTERIAAKPFSLQTDTLLRCAHYKGRLGSFVILVMHHIISDGWSMHIFSQEIRKALAAIRKEGEYNVPQLQYKDYAAWNRNLVKENAGAKNYWHALLEEPCAPTVITSDNNRPSWRTFNGNTNSYIFDSLISKAVQDFCARQQVTLYSFLAAALNLLIHRYTGLHTITIGSPVSGRTHADLENQLGFYLNNIVLRSELKGDVSFIDFLSRVHQQVLQALQYQDYPFDKLVDDLLTERDASHSPFFDIYLALQNNEAPETDFGLFSFAPLHFSRKVSRYDLNFMFEERDGLQLLLQYNTDLFSQKTIDAIWKHLYNIVAEVVTDATTTVASVNLLEIDEVNYLSKSVKALPVCESISDKITRPIPGLANNTINYYFDEQVRKTPDNIALYAADAQFTYKELDIISTNIAKKLIKTGVEKGDVVSLYIGKNAHRVIGILAVLKAGATYLPLDTNLPETRLTTLTVDAGSVVLLTDKATALSWFDGKVVISNIDLHEHEEINLPVVDENANAYILYTSGTTGKPKGVVVTHANVISLMKHTGLYDFSENDTWTLFHQYNFDFTVWEIWGALLFGGKLVVVSDEMSKDLEAFATMIVEQKVTVLNQTPPVFYLVSELLASKYSAEDLSALRYVIFGGDVLRPSLLKAFADKFPHVKLVNMYGITETTVHVTCKLLSSADLLSNHSNIGKPIPTLSTYILDEYMQLSPYGMPGQLAIAGKGLSKGYLNDEILTAKKFIYHPVIKEKIYLSGDLARFLPNGDIEYLGRVDQQVKVRGHRIEPGEIEYALQNTGLAQKAVVLKTGEADMSKLVAYVIPMAEWKQNDKSLNEVLQMTGSGLALSRLPNDMPLFHKNDSETRFMYREIVTEDGYMLQNMQLSDRPVIIDAGANIGMFSTLVASLWSKATIYAFEPMPEIYKCLSANAALYAPGRLIPVNEGLSDCRGEFELHYYAMNTVMSGGGSNDKELLGSYVRSQYADSGEYSEDVISAVVDEALDAVSVTCKMRTLSDVIDDFNIDYIDLVKIDVEEWEQKLIDGIRDEHWNIIGNIVAEVHDIDDRVASLSSFLTGKGFNIEAQQTNILKGVALYNVKASKAKINGIVPGTGKRYDAFTAPHEDWYVQDKLSNAIKSGLVATLPPYMVPDAIITVDDFPLTVNGKLDRNKLLQTTQTDAAETETAVVLSKRAETLFAIVGEVLQRKVMPGNNFFEIGGNSLNATQVINRVRSRMKIDLRVRDIFEHPVMRDLSACVEQLHSSNFPDIVPVAVKKHYALSDAQQRIFTTSIIDGADSVAYNMTGGLLLNGVPDVRILEHAFSILITRHEILRTRFAEVAGEFVQIPCNDVKLNIVQKEAPELSEIICRQLILQDAATSFDLQKTPLLRCALYTTLGKSLLVVSMHHIISDGWSMGVMTRELTEIYNVLKHGGDISLPALNFQYKDYCGWLEALLNNESWVTAEKTFWKTELEGFEALMLPYDYARNKIQTYKGSGLTHYIEEWHKIKELAGKENISLYAFLLATVNVLFAKISGQHDIIVGTPVAGRPLLALEQQIGFYVNTLPVRMNIHGYKTFAEVLKAAQKKSVDVLEHQLYPFNRIAEDVTGTRNMNDSPLFNVLFVWQNNNEPEYVLDGITGQKVDVDYESSIFDLSFIFAEVNDMLKMTLQYNSSLFAKDTVEALVTMFNSLVIATAPGFNIDIESIEL